MDKMNIFRPLLLAIWIVSCADTKTDYVSLYIISLHDDNIYEFFIERVVYVGGDGSIVFNVVAQGIEHDFRKLENVELRLEGDNNIIKGDAQLINEGSNLLIQCAPFGSELSLLYRLGFTILLDEEIKDRLPELSSTIELLRPK